MASDESMILLSSTQEDEYDDADDGFDQHPHLHSLSRLSVCTSSMYTNEDEEDGEVDGGMDGVMMNYMSRLSIESFDADDEEFLDSKGCKGVPDISSEEEDDDSDKEYDCYSLPATPPRRRSRGVVVNRQVVVEKDYASENEAQKSLVKKKMRRSLGRRRIIRERCGQGKNREEENMNSISGESDHAGGGGSGVLVITRPKGGSRSLCMDLEEVKACRDLGFELEHERMLEMPSRLSLSASTLETTSSGGTSPIANWRISSPG